MRGEGGKGGGGERVKGERGKGGERVRSMGCGESVGEER